jgi:hypothetical protein
MDRPDRLTTASDADRDSDDLAPRSSLALLGRADELRHQQACSVLQRRQQFVGTLGHHHVAGTTQHDGS